MSKNCSYVNIYMCLLFDEIILKLLVKLRIFFEIRFKLSEI